VLIGILTAPLGWLFAPVFLLVTLFEALGMDTQAEAMLAWAQSLAGSMGEFAVGVLDFLFGWLG